MTELSAKVCSIIDAAIQKFPEDRKKSAVMPALMAAQEENGGWLTYELIDAVASYLDLAKIAVYEVATFYSMYNLSPVGRYRINLCNNVSCMLCGCADILQHIQQKLDICPGQTTKDGMFSLQTVECLGACGGAPMMQVNDKYYENLTTETVDQILNDIHKDLK